MSTKEDNLVPLADAVKQILVHDGITNDFCSNATGNINNLIPCNFYLQNYDSNYEIVQRGKNKYPTVL